MEKRFFRYDLLSKKALGDILSGRQASNILWKNKGKKLPQQSFFDKKIKFLWNFIGNIFTMKYIKVGNRFSDFFPRVCGKD